jgi:hypothetical protein
MKKSLFILLAVLVLTSLSYPPVAALRRCPGRATRRRPSLP